MDEIQIRVLGSGTSAGIPTVGCQCAVCLSDDPRDKRLRPSILLRYQGRNIVIDTTPDLRRQALDAGLLRLDAILFTHSHADHIMGLDDIRPFNFRQGEIPVYASAETLRNIRSSFHYIFESKDPESAIPRLAVNVLNGGSFDVFGLNIRPVRLAHGRTTVYGFRFGRAAYLTDHSDIPEASVELLQGLDVLFLDALRHRPHPTHSTVETALSWVEKLKPNRAFFTHMCHDLGHAETERSLPPHVRLAYDGMEITTQVDG